MNKKSPQEWFIENNESDISRIFLRDYEYLIDGYMTIPVCNVSCYVNKWPDAYVFKFLPISAEICSFYTISECIDFINRIRESNYFYIYSINEIGGNIILRYKGISLDMNIVGKEHLKKMNIRNKKIDEILA